MELGVPGVTGPPVQRPVDLVHRSERGAAPIQNLPTVEQTAQGQIQMNRTVRMQSAHVRVFTK